MGVRPTWKVLIALLVVVGASVPVAAVLGGDPPGTDVTGDTQAVTALGTEFTYQGRLEVGGDPAAGVYDLRFIVYDSESGGSQVGPTVEKAAVPVARGFFTVLLDFGDETFTGGGRWLEVAVRETGSPLFYSVLSPRQPITAVPYALFARSSDLALPFAGTGAVAAPEPLFTLTQTDSGIGVEVRRTYAGESSSPALFGSNSGAGAGVQGESGAAGEPGVRGLAAGAGGIGVEGSSTASDGVGGSFQGPTGILTQTSSDGDALHLAGGALRMSGEPSPAFVHTVVTAGDGANTCGANGTVLSSPLLDGTPDAVVLVTPRSSSGLTASAVDARALVVAYAPTTTCDTSAEHWVVFGSGDAFANGETIDVLVVNR